MSAGGYPDFCSMPAASSDVDISEYLDEYGEYHAGNLEVGCPNCGHRCRPFRVALTHSVDGGLRWVGISYQEPYTVHATRCSSCGCPFTFITHTPQ